MEVDDNDRGFLFESRDNLVGYPKRTIQGRHKNASRKIDNSDGALCPTCYGKTTSRGVWRVVCRPDDPVVAVNKIINILVVPDVIAHGQYIYSGAKQIVGYIPGDAVAACGIFTVGNSKPGLIFFFREGSSS